MEDENTIRALEAHRCAALSAGDLDGVAALLDDDYLHIHGNGRVTDKAATLARLGSLSRRTERGPLSVQVWGDAALLVGEQVNRAIDAAGVEIVTRAMVSQTVRRREGVWRFLSLQFTPLKD